MTSRMFPGFKVPELHAVLLDGSSWSLVDQKTDQFTLLVFFRHSNCSICQNYLKDLDRLVGHFAELGVNILAMSVDSAVATSEMAEKLSLKKLKIGGELSLDTAEQWGLFVSAKRKEGAPDQFFEPALFLIDSSGLTYYTSIQSMPFGRTVASEILQWIPKIIANDIPARGEVKV